jgi:hypothetical protein
LVCLSLDVLKIRHLIMSVNAGKLQDVHVEQPVDDEEEQEPLDVKGKRKAPPI